MQFFCNFFERACSLCSSVTSSALKILSSMPTLKASLPARPYFFFSVSTELLCHYACKESFTRKIRYKRELSHGKRRSQSAVVVSGGGNRCQESRCGGRSACVGRWSKRSKEAPTELDAVLTIWRSSQFRQERAKSSQLSPLARCVRLTSSESSRRVL